MWYEVHFKISHHIPNSYLLTPWCRVLLELVKKFPAFHGPRRFITALTTVRHLSLSWASPIQSIYPHPNFWRSILILSTHLRLGLPSGLFPSGFPTKTLYTPLSSPIRATSRAHLILRLSLTTSKCANFSYWRRVLVIYHKTRLYSVESQRDGCNAEPIKNFQTLGQFRNLFVYMRYRNSK